MMARVPQNVRYKKVKDAVIAAVGTFHRNNKTFQESFAIFNPGTGLLQRLDSEFNWEIYTKVGDTYEQIEIDYDKREAAAAVASVPKFGIVAANAYLEAFIHQLLNDTFDALYADLTGHELPFLKHDAQLPAGGKLDSAKLAHKAAQLKELTQLNWSGNLESKLAEFFVAAVNGQELMEKLLDELGKQPNPPVWHWQFEDSAGRRHKLFVSPRDVQTLASMANFFYGVRCMIAHGDTTNTTSFGALSDEPSCNYSVHGVTYYNRDTRDQFVSEFSQFDKHETVTLIKNRGHSIEKQIVVVERKNGRYAKTTKLYRRYGSQVELQKAGIDRMSLPYFDRFLNEETAGQVEEELKNYFFGVWNKAKQNDLAVDHLLFMSMLNFNTYYIQKIALVCLWICHTVIYGDSVATSEGFLSTVRGIEDVFQDIRTSTLRGATN